MLELLVTVGSVSILDFHGIFATLKMQAMSKPHRATVVERDVMAGNAMISDSHQAAINAPAGTGRCRTLFAHLRVEDCIFWPLPRHVTSSDNREQLPCPRPWPQQALRRHGLKLVKRYKKGGKYNVRHQILKTGCGLRRRASDCCQRACRVRP
jgi:hypothetical protein